MAVIQRAGRDACVIAVGARHRFTFRSGALEMLLDPAPGLRVTRVPVTLGAKEVGDLTLTPTGRTLIVRIDTPSRRFLAKAETARRLLRGELNAVPLIDMTDPGDGPAPASTRPAARSEPAPPASAPERPLPTHGRDAAFEDVLHGIHACPSGLTCRPGRGHCYPAAPRGRPQGGTDVLLVGWNPRVTEYATGELPAFDDWMNEGATALADAARTDAPWSRHLPHLLPDGYALTDPRVMSTFLWKWPTRTKSGSEGERFYATRCVTKHTWDEVAAVRPRVLVTFHTEAAAYLRDVAEAHGLTVRPPPAPLANAETGGRILTTDAWGWRMGVVLAHDPEGTRYHPDTVRWARLAVAKGLEETADA